ncbi:MAG: hypothetical protein HOV81_12000 [Kofleriaceae bacterium]|nr:hypothetical protein [Kofleriaceae bacterium]
MAVTKCKVFHGVGAVVAEVTSNSTFDVIAIISDDDVIDFVSKPGLRFPIKQELCPSECGFANWDSVELDDRGIKNDGSDIGTEPMALQFPLAITSIGVAGKTKEPAHGSFIGAVYLEHETHKNLLPTNFPKWPGDKYRAEELTSITYINDMDVRTRYHGFVATVTAVAANGDVTVKLDNETDDKGNPLTWTFARTDSSYDHNPPKEAVDPAQSLAAMLNPGKTGILFVELMTALTKFKDLTGKTVGARGPKLPVGFEE